MTYALGLDLGTTYTAAAVCRDGRCEISPLGNRAAVVPSVVHLAADGASLVGEAAQRRATTDAARVAREFKRRFGDPTPLLLAGTPIAPEALTARLAEGVVAAVAEREGVRPERITVTHPATWGPFKLDLLDQAMRMAHLSPVTLLSEPEAAAWEYASIRPLAPGSTVAVYDLGGGTFDATVLRADAGRFELLGEPEGIERLGGIDIDQAVFAFVVSALDGAVEALDPDDPVAVAALARLRSDCVEAKEALSSDHEAAIAVVLPTVQTEVRITRPELEALIRPVMGDTVAAMRRALSSAGVDPAELSAVLLVGGSSRIPMVGELVGEMLGRPVAVDAHPKHLVALGAARHAAAGGVLPSGPGAATAPPPPPAAPPTLPPPATPPAAVPTAPPPATPPAVTPPATMPAPAPATPPTPPPGATVAPVGPPASVPPVTAAPGRSSSKALAAVGGLVGLVVVAVGALLLFGGGSGGDDAAATGAPVADCPSSGPFVCITEVRRAASGGLEAEFVPVDVRPTNPGTGSTSLVFFLADVIRNDHGTSVVSAGAPIEWGATLPFRGWSDQQLAGRAAVCALVVENGTLQVGTGNCRPLP